MRSPRLTAYGWDGGTENFASSSDWLSPGASQPAWSRSGPPPIRASAARSAAVYTGIASSPGPRTPGHGGHPIAADPALPTLPMIAIAAAGGIPHRGLFTGNVPGNARRQRLMLAVPHPLVRSARVAELVVAALLGDHAVVEDHDVVDLVQPV